MRIYLSFLQSGDTQHPIPAYKFWQAYLKPGLEESGYQWLEHPTVDWASGLMLDTDDHHAVQTWRDRTWGPTIAAIRTAHQEQPINLFLSYCYPHMVEEAAIRDIQAMGIPCVNYFCDNIRNFRTIPASFGIFDLNWVPEKNALPLYHKQGFASIHLPMPMWVDPKFRTLSKEECYGPTFIGTRDAQREMLFAEALKYGAKLELRGRGWGPPPPHTPSMTPTPPPPRAPWPTVLKRQLAMVQQEQSVSPLLRKVANRFRKPLPDRLFEAHVRPAPNHDEFIEICQKSRIFLGVTRYPSLRYPFHQPNTYARLREIEAPMLGACYLTEWAAELEDLFKIGEEIETYHDAREMVAKITRLEADPALRTRLRRAGQKRALSEHSIGRSMEKIIQRFRD
ncbi:MAG: glycosyltransferase family 1 protein [Magnetococcales bacterium]|nr:glycosyltransferase family 1 protein [Magnetococcales bacterium]